MAWELLIAVVLYVVGELIRKPNFPEDREAVPFEDAGIPKIDPRAPKAVLWGKDTIRDPHVMDAVEYFQIEVTQKVKATLFKSKNVVVGHRYFVGMQLGLGEGPLTMTRIYYDNQLLWEGVAGQNDDGVAITLDLPQFLGGKEEGGGIVGTIRFYSGTSTQNVSAYLDGFHSTLTPAYRRVCYVVFEGVEIGESPKLDAFGFEVARYPNNLGLLTNRFIDGEVFNPETNVYDVDTDSELNPAELLFELWTNQRWGMKRPTGDMDVAQWNAAGDILATEQHGISLKWVRKQSNKKIAETVTRQIQGMVVFNNNTGLWELRLARAPTAGELTAAPLFQPSADLVRVNNFSRMTQSDLITQTSIQWVDRTITTRPDPEQAANMALFYALQSRHQSQALNMPGVHYPTLARNIASRENKQGSFPVSTLEIEVSREAFNLLPNDIFKWAFDQYGIVQIVYRVTAISPGKARLGQFRITAVQDVFSVAETIFDNQPPLTVSLQQPPANIPDLLSSEQPWYLATQDEEVPTVDQTGASEDDTLRPYYLAEAPVAGSPLEVRGHYERNDDAAPVAGLRSDILGNYCPKGALTLELGLGAGLGGTAGTSMIVTGLSGRDIAQINDDYENIATLPALVDRENRINYGFLNLILLTDPADVTYDGVTTTDAPKQEFVSVIDWTQLANGDIDFTVRRGMGDTPPQLWPVANTEVWFVSSAVGRFSQAAKLAPFDQFIEGELWTVGLTNISNTGESALASAPTRGDTMTNRANRPLPAGDMEINGEQVPTTTVAIGGDADATWNHRNRLSRNVVVGQGDNSLEQQFWEDGDADDLDGIWTGTPTFEYFLRIYDDILDALERTETQSTTGFNYTNALQVTDGGPFARLRFELRARQISGGVPLNLIDVIRIINVRIPLPLLKRGPVYDVIATQAPQTHYPCQEASGNLANVGVDGGGDLVVNGTAAYRQPGPDNHTFSIFFPAGVGNYLSIADATTNDLSTSTPGSMVCLFFRCSKVDGVNNTVVWSKGSVTDIDAPQIQLYMDTGGRLNFRGTGAATLGTRPSGAPPVDDGQWHYLCLWFQSSVVRLWVDMEPYARGSGSIFPSGAFPFFFGCGNDSSSAGVVDMAFAHIHWYKQDTPSNVGSAGNPLLLHCEIQRAPREWAVSRSAYLRQIIAENPLLHYIGGMAEPEWTTNEEHHMQDFMLSGARSANERPHWTDGDSLDQIPDANMHLAGPMVGQAFNFAWDQAAFRTSFQAGVFGAGSGDPQIMMDVSETATEHTFCGWINVNSAPSQRSPISVVCGLFGSNPASPERVGMYLNSSLKLEVYANFASANNGSNTNAVIVEADDAILTGRWYFVGYRKTDGQIAEIMLDGRIVASTETVNGTGTSAQWWDDWATGSGRGRTQHFGSGAFSDDSSVGENHQPLDGLLCQLSVWPEEFRGVDTFERLYKAAFSAEQSMNEVLARDNPEHLYVLEDSTDAGDQFTHSGDAQPTATGTFELDTLPIEADPIPGKVITPLGFLGDARLAYPSGLLENNSTTDLVDILVVAAFRTRDVTGEVQDVVSNQPAAESSTDRNFGMTPKKDANDSILWTVFPPTAENLESPAGTLEVGVGVLVAFKETGAAGGKAREMYIDSALEVSDSGDVDEYTGAATTRMLVGNRNTDNNRFLDGDVAYLAAYDRDASRSIILRAALRFGGRTADEIAVLQHGLGNPGMVLYMRGDSPLTRIGGQGGATTHSVTMHNLVNDAGSEDLVLTNVPTSVQPAGVVPPGWKFARALRCTSSSSEDANMSWLGTAAFPLCLGGWFRVHTAAADAFVTMSDSLKPTEFVQVGIINDLAGINIDGTERTSGAVTQGDWAHVVCVFVSAASKFLYLNGELQTEFTESEAIPTAPDTLSINSRITTDATVYGDGEYAGVFAGNVNLTATEVMEIYSAGLYDGALAAARHEAADMAYTLDEYIDSLLTFQDSLDLTEVGIGTGVVQGATGIIPLRKSLCVDFDGSGDIDLARVDYPAGSTNRVLEFWIEAGFVGVVCSMGANVDAESLTIVVDATGDLRCHIRGTGNERIWTTALDVGTDPFHVAIELNGTLLTDIECYVDGVLATVGTAGSGTTINTTATENLVLGQLHANLTTLPGGTPYIDGTGKLAFFAVYSAEWGSTTTLSARTALHHALAGAG